MATQLREPETPLEPPVPSDEPQPERDYEAEARERGWVPADEFKGSDPKRFVDAKTFIERTDTMMPLLKADRDRLKREMADLKRDFRKASEHFSKAEERAYERALTDLRQRQEEAVETGDVAAHRKISGEIDKLREDLPTPQQAHTIEEAQNAFEDWREGNPWYDRGLKVAAASETEQSAALYADRMTEKHKAKTADMAPAEFFAFIEDLVVEKFPTIKTKPTREKPPSDVAGPTGNRGRTAGKTFADIGDPEARRMAERLADKWVKSGLLKNRDEYLKGYDWNKA